MYYKITLTKCFCSFFYLYLYVAAVNIKVLLILFVVVKTLIGCNGNISSAFIHQNANVKHNQTSVAALIHADTFDIDSMSGKSKHLSITSHQH